MQTKENRWLRRFDLRRVSDQLVLDGLRGAGDDVHKETTANAVEVFEDVATGRRGSQGWHVR